MNAGTRPLGVTLLAALASAAMLPPSRCEASARYSFTDLGRTTNSRLIFTADGLVDPVPLSPGSLTRSSDGGYFFTLKHLDYGIQRTYASFEGGAPVPIPNLSPTPNTYAFAVNTSGVFVGMSSSREIDSQQGIAISFTMDGGTKPIAVPFGDSIGVAYGINDANQIVGTYNHNYNGGRGFLTEGQSTWDLNTLVDTYDQFLITGASDINASGQILARAFDSKDQVDHYLLLTPQAAPVPEPSTLLLVAAGVTFGIFRKKVLRACPFAAF